MTSSFHVYEYTIQTKGMQQLVCTTANTAMRGTFCVLICFLKHLYLRVTSCSRDTEDFHCLWFSVLTFSWLNFWANQNSRKPGITTATSGDYANGPHMFLMFRFRSQHVALYFISEGGGSWRITLSFKLSKSWLSAAVIINQSSSDDKRPTQTVWVSLCT